MSDIDRIIGSLNQVQNMKPQNLTTNSSRLISNSFIHLILLIFTFSVHPILAADTYSSNMSHSEIRFYYDHGGVAENSGEFTNFSVTLVLDEENIGNSSITLTIQADSLVSGVSSLDRRLKSATYFSVEAHPEIVFKSTEFHKISESEFTIAGELTIRGITKFVEIVTILHHKGRHKMVAAFPTVYNGQWVGIKATTHVLRSGFDMKAFIPMISDQVRVEVNLELQMKNQ